MDKTAVEIGANTFQFFTRNPRGSAAKPLDKKDMNTIGSHKDRHEKIGKGYIGLDAFERFYKLQ